MTPTGPKALSSFFVEKPERSVPDASGWSDAPPPMRTVRMVTESVDGTLCREIPTNRLAQHVAGEVGLAKAWYKAALCNSEASEYWGSKEGGRNA